MPKPTPPSVHSLPATLVEDVTKRTQNAKHYSHGDGRTFTAILGRNLHYKLPDNTWDDVDTSFVVSGTDRIVQRTGKPVKATATTIEVIDSATGKGIRFTPPAALTTDTKQARFTAAGITWAYTPTPEGLKLDATLAAAVGARSIPFPYVLINNATPLTIVNGDVVSDAFTIPAPYAIGADRQRYNIGTWSLATTPTPRIVFNYNDAGIPSTAFPLYVDPTTTFNEAASADDGYLDASGATWPPAFVATNTTSNQLVVTRGFSAGTYYIRLSMLKFDTSSLTSAATISAASLILKLVTTPSLDANFTFQADYYASSNWPIDSGDYTTSNLTGTAATIVNASMPSAIGTWTIALTNPNTNISKTGVTGFRLSYSSTGTPTTFAQVSPSGFDDVTPANRPTLSVTYSTGPSGTLAIVTPQTVVDLGTPTTAKRLDIISTASVMAFAPLVNRVGNLNILTTASVLTFTPTTIPSAIAPVGRVYETPATIVTATITPL